ncbi:hypothetical protein SBA5_200024 [Candidatus Sulfotelmatomonas gaucii]|uniref:Uncharacterized protein n=1 Tax=Candidatus Sulfuritelmatomonas gaucii TaxID=2043161 RepID=A0A2N9L739_9BACT|nr:hypothetical protein SBA5_200024 [Candidatus Sulfotelmatomonas gaucii]
MIRMLRVSSNRTYRLIENALPDGSRVIVDNYNEKIDALNATAGAAWDACGKPTTLSHITEAMKSTVGPAVTEELAEQAVFQLQEQNLVLTSEPLSQNGRRQFLMGLGVVALPLVVSLTMGAEQALAICARSRCEDGRPAG